MNFNQGQVLTPTRLQFLCCGMPQVANLSRCCRFCLQHLRSQQLPAGWVMPVRPLRHRKRWGSGMNSRWSSVDSPVEMRTWSETGWVAIVNFRYWTILKVFFPTWLSGCFFLKRCSFLCSSSSILPPPLYRDYYYHYWCCQCYCRYCHHYYTGTCHLLAFGYLAPMPLLWAAVGPGRNAYYQHVLPCSS